MPASSALLASATTWQLYAHPTQPACLPKHTCSKVPKSRVIKRREPTYFSRAQLPRLDSGPTWRRRGLLLLLRRHLLLRCWLLLHRHPRGHC